jgi:hypothetical protein
VADRLPPAATRPACTFLNFFVVAAAVHAAGLRPSFFVFRSSRALSKGLNTMNVQPHSTEIF